MVHFFIGLDHPAVAWPFVRSMISINTIRDRKGPFRVNDWIMDSGGFTELSTYGRWRTSPKEYAAQINRWKDNGNLVAAVTQDLMCEPFILHKTGLSVDDHQKITVERYARLIDLTNVYVMPVLQRLLAGLLRHPRLSLRGTLNARSMGWRWQCLQAQR